MSVHHHQIAVPAVRPVVWIQPAMNAITIDDDRSPMMLKMLPTQAPVAAYCT
jgi:hypothetical protein